MSFTFHLIPHVHWDREWYLTRHGFLARLVPMLDGLLDLLEAHPTLRFHLDGQTVIVDDYLAVAPQQRTRLQRLVERGQLALGPWYVLADELIPRGGSLRRNLELGIASSASLGGHSRVLYSPDAFGHPAGLPDLATLFALPWAVLWRGLGRVAGRSHDLYRWIGPGGGSVLVYHLPPEGYEMGIDLVTAGTDLSARWRGLRDRLTARAVCEHVAVPVGADHHTPSVELPGLVERIAAIEPDAAVRFSSFDEFFQAVEATAPALQSLHGELRQSPGYVWSLQGVHSTRMRMKRRHSEVESMLLDVVDPLTAAMSPAEKALLEQAWRLLVQAQFHDTIAGCAADGVAREQAVRLDAVAAIAGELAAAGFDRLISHDPNAARRRPDLARPTLVLWHSDSEPFTGVVIVRTTWFKRDVLVGPAGNRVPDLGPGYQPFHLRTPEGAAVPVQLLRVSEGTERIDASEYYPDLDLVDEVWIAFRVSDMPDKRPYLLQAVAGFVSEALVDGDSLCAEEQSLRNDRIEVVVDADGSFSISDRSSGRRVTGLGAIESEPDRGDLYTPDVDQAVSHRARMLEVRGLARGPLVAALELRWELQPAMGGLVRGRTVLSLHAGEAAVRVRVEFDNWATDHRLRLRLPLAVGDQVIAGSPFGTERRGAGRFDTSWSGEAGLPTAPAHDFLRPAGAGRPGFRLDLPGFFEYELTDRGEVLITLLRAVGVLSRNDLATRRGHAGWAMPTPEAAEPGRHVVTMAIGTEATGRMPSSRWLRGSLSRADDHEPLRRS